MPLNCTSCRHDIDGECYHGNKEIQTCFEAKPQAPPTTQGGVSNSSDLLVGDWHFNWFEKTGYAGRRLGEISFKNTTFNKAVNLWMVRDRSKTTKLTISFTPR